MGQPFDPAEPTGPAPGRPPEDVPAADAWTIPADDPLPPGATTPTGRPSAPAGPPDRSSPSPAVVAAGVGIAVLLGVGAGLGLAATADDDRAGPTSTIPTATTPTSSSSGSSIPGPSTSSSTTTTSVTTTAAGPAPGETWRSAFGVLECDRWRDPFPAVAPGPSGVGTDGQGLIVIESSTDGSAPTLGDLLDVVGVDVTDTRVVLPDGSFRADGELCPDGSPGFWVVARWGPTGGPEPLEVVTADLAAVPLTGDGEAFALAFVPGGADLEPPPSLAGLDRPG